MIQQTSRLPCISEYVCNRADEITDVFADYGSASDAVRTMLDQGRQANPEKEVIQWEGTPRLGHS
ncbi:hypothetical protein N7491_010575 [Penicillium cf. griseofulvum]|uniref:Uncharacterized protein n=1 Tax=Penicillium cf. griseofulvum TaxID=2972120 RepID=A0A9W9N031_9EURO|nr:hypothetical protein N7472_000903 [Penicillium cf. griseofulvum]KAJ5422130.1 hypothetical protein N7491_010575 [Penicillium cf. griseofulvum]KAJ5428316.1 hypothetical protein N7445_009770 [Penicillium cf. griseofulvum]